MRGKQQKAFLLASALNLIWKLAASDAAFQIARVPFASRVSQVGVSPVVCCSGGDLFQNCQFHQRDRAISTVVLHLSSSNPGDSGETTVKAGSSVLVTHSDAVRSQLFSAFTNLGVADQYDAVLTGLCAKILDTAGSRITETQAAASLRDCTDLLQEMNEQKIPASPRSLMALIDVGLYIYIATSGYASEL